MNVTLEDLAPCKKLVRFEIDAKAVDEKFETTTKEFIREAAMPGFRAGKAPREMVLKKYEKEIQDEVKRKLIVEAYQQGIKDQRLKVVGYPDIEEIQFGPGKPLQFAATIETAPEFEIPDYRGVPAKREVATVTDEDMERALSGLRGQQANFVKVDRPVQEGDFVVVNYTGTVDGKPILDFAPAARGLTEQKNFWVEIKPDSFIPGFATQLLGARGGEKRTVTVDFAADFVTSEVAGKRGVYDVEIVEVKERQLPAFDDAFAKSFGAETVDKLREGVRRDLQNELNMRVKRSVRNQVIQFLLDRLKFDLPESLVNQETRNIVYEIVGENQKRGISKEVIDKQKEEIYAVANRQAQERVKASFLFQRIAEKEGIRVLPEELNARIVVLARNYDMPADKFLKELEKRDGLSDIHNQLLNEKVIEFLHENARIEDVAPASPPAS